MPQKLPLGPRVVWDSDWSTECPPGYRAFKMVVTLAQMGPPILKLAAILAFLTWQSAGAWPVSCQ